MRVTVGNGGTGQAPGTKGNPTGYQVNMVLSQDATVPMGWATQPVYAGYTPDDFVEDMLVLGGRISNTDSVPAGGSVTYNLPIPIPAKTAPGVYCLAAVVDPGNVVMEANEANNITYLRLQIAAEETAGIRPPPGVGLWVMPFGVGGTRLDAIKPTGLTDYAGLTNAPFGWHLGLRHGYASAIPNPVIGYYRWMYRRKGTSN